MCKLIVVFSGIQNILRLKISGWIEIKTKKAFKK